MKIGIGLPFQTSRDSWRVIETMARKADAGPYSSFAVIDRLAFDNYEPLVMLAALAAVTKRIRLMTAVLVGPLRRAGVLAKQAATIDAISGGRLTLGIAVGSREDDALVAPSGFHDRGVRFNEQLELMRAIWRGEIVNNAQRPVGPEPAQKGGPELLIGGTAARAIARVGKYADGYVMGGRALDREWAMDILRQVNDSWKASRRTGAPRVVASMLTALGPGAEDAVHAAVAGYYSGDPARLKERAVRGNPASAEAIRDAVKLHEDLGTDELVLKPAKLDPEQVDRLTEVVSRLTGC
jgi:alkanesulfonate monooxygenase SsuD/methylene tetrahydromethanopterin reductase-like flavin-dependent oxidoreductase (luciferase family)